MKQSKFLNVRDFINFKDNLTLIGVMELLELKKYSHGSVFFNFCCAEAWFSHGNLQTRYKLVKSLIGYLTVPENLEKCKLMYQSYWDITGVYLRNETHCEKLPSFLLWETSASSSWTNFKKSSPLKLLD